ncbi:hypothetical protein WMW72_33775 [Paenibacillus filicis]|uniref:Heat induced stress protein YflT n=1 Tax=Paenibacillus filicis TaxID=669464 RepID=A0ABU9DVF0_9BACL
MSQHIQAYFHNESDAEHVRSLLQTYPIEQIEVGAIEEAPDHSLLLFPLGAAVGSSNAAIGAAGASYPSGSTGGTAAAFVGLNEAERISHDANNDGVDDREHHYALSAHVKEGDYREVVDLIRSNGGAVLREDDTV